MKIILLYCIFKMIRGFCRGGQPDVSEKVSTGVQAILARVES